MGKIRKCKLSWKSSESDHIVGYRLYWSNEDKVDYDSAYIKVGNTNEVALPDVLIDSVAPGATIYLGVSAVDKIGNESDMITLAEPYEFSVLPAPMDLTLTAMDDYTITMITMPKKGTEVRSQDQSGPKTQPDQYESQPNGSRPAPKFVTTEGRIVDNFSYGKS
jgi:hypothetical protein